MAETESYYYRGTTRGWPGSPNLVEFRVTFATTDPLVATLFAIECRSRGEAAVLVASAGKFPVLHSASSPVQGPVNLSFTLPEGAVELSVLPSEFERDADYIIPVEDAISLLIGLGFDPLPARIASHAQLDELIRETYNAGQRLTLRQIHEFNRMLRGGVL